MIIDAVGVTSKNLKQTVKFYNLLGFEFPEFNDDEMHLEPINNSGVRLMIDKDTLVEEILGVKPQPSNHSSFAIKFDSPEQVDNITNKLKAQGFNIVKEPWDAFWGQRYAIVKDPDGYMIDLFAAMDHIQYK